MDYKLLKMPDVRLRQKSSKVEAFDDNLKALANEVYKVMHDERGIGLAAIQLNVPKQLIAINVNQEISNTMWVENGFNLDDSKMNFLPEHIFMVNPVILSKHGDNIIFREGCLSVAGGWAYVKRPEFVTVVYYDLDGVEHKLDAGGLLSRCIMHEVDHLDGKLFIDYLNPVKRDMILQKCIKEKNNTD